jgi:hypothetical protein
VISPAVLVQMRAYRDSFARAKASRYMDFPYCVHLETVTRCSADCTFCPYGTLARKGTRMSDELVAKVLDDLAAIPRDLPFTFFPFKVSDPFSEPRLFPLLATVNDRLPNARICLITNGIGVTERRFAEVAQLRNVCALCISLNDHRAAPYESLMRLPLARVLERLDAIHAMVDEPPFPIALTRVGDGSAVDDEWLAFCRARYPRFHAALHPRMDWVGAIKDFAVPETPDLPCLRWFDVSISSTGVVALCCADGEGRYPIGDVRTSSVLEVYNAPAFRRLRETVLSRRDVSPCNGCSVLGFARFLDEADVPTIS